MIKYIKNYILCKRFPFLRIKNVWNGKKLSYKFTELDSLPNGWRKRFGIDICNDLNNAFKKSQIKHFNRMYFITQIKEKYGTLRWYDNGVPEDIVKEYDGIIKKYEDLSGVTCIECGKEAQIRDIGGWYEPLCDKCLEDLTKERMN